MSSGPEHGSDGTTRSPYLDEGRTAYLTAPIEVERLRSELAEARSLVRTVDLCGTGFIWRDPDAGRARVLQPEDVDVMVSADQHTEYERLRSELAEAERARVRLEHHALDLGDRLEQVAPVVAAAAALCAKARPGRELHIDGPVLRAEFRALHAAVAALPVSLLPAATNPGSNDEQA